MAGSDLYTGSLDLLILKATSWGPLHGYAIGRWIRQSTDEALSVQEGDSLEKAAPIFTLESTEQEAEVAAARARVTEAEAQLADAKQQMQRPSEIEVLEASLAFAAAAIALAERIDTSFHTVDDLRSFTRVPVLVSIPPLRTHAARWRTRRRFAWMALVTVTGMALIGAATWFFAHRNIDLVELLARGSTS